MNQIKKVQFDTVSEISNSIQIPQDQEPKRTKLTNIKNSNPPTCEAVQAQIGT